MDQHESMFLVRNPSKQQVALTGSRLSEKTGKNISSSGLRGGLSRQTSPQTQRCGDVLSGTQEPMSSLHSERISFLSTMKAGFGGQGGVTLGFQGTLLECKPLKKTPRSRGLWKEIKWRAFPEVLDI